MEYIIKQLEKYPLMEEEDLLKLIAQRCFGPGHLILNLDRAMDYMSFEFQEAKDENYEYDEKIEEIGSGLVRINLGAYPELPDWLIDALLYTDNTFKTDPELFKDLVNKIAVYIEEKKLDLSVAKFKNLATKIASDEYEPVHHSVHYREIYHPHYRLVYEKYIRK